MICKQWRSAFTMHLRRRDSRSWLKFFSGRARILYEDLPPEFIGWPSGPLTSNARRAYPVDLMHCRPRRSSFRSVQPSRPKSINLREWIFLDDDSSTGTSMINPRVILTWRQFRGAVTTQLRRFISSTSFDALTKLGLDSSNMQSRTVA